MEYLYIVNRKSIGIFPSLVPTTGTIYSDIRVLLQSRPSGEIPKRLKGHVWRTCMAARSSRVRIPLSPQRKKSPKRFQRCWNVEIFEENFLRCRHMFYYVYLLQ